MSDTAVQQGWNRITAAIVSRQRDPRDKAITLSSQQSSTIVETSCPLPTLHPLVLPPALLGQIQTTSLTDPSIYPLFYSFGEQPSPSRPYEHKQGEGKLDRPSSPEADAALIRGKSEALLWKPIIMEAASSKLEGAEVGSAGNHGASRGRDDDAKPQDGNNVPAFESILIFGGVADGSVIGVGPSERWSSVLIT